MISSSSSARQIFFWKGTKAKHALGVHSFQRHIKICYNQKTCFVDEKNLSQFNDVLHIKLHKYVAAKKRCEVISRGSLLKLLQSSYVAAMNLSESGGKFKKTLKQTNKQTNKQKTENEKKHTNYWVMLKTLKN